LSASLIYAWKLGLKTGQYYLRSRPARDAIQFTVDVETLDVKENNYNSKNLSKQEMDD
jgi:ribonucleotide reductase alpha subunit